MSNKVRKSSGVSYLMQKVGVRRTWIGLGRHLMVPAWYQRCPARCPICWSHLELSDLSDSICGHVAMAIGHFPCNSSDEVM